MEDSITYLKRERDVIKRILNNLDYANIKDIPEIELQVFEGKYFQEKDFTVEELLVQILKIATKLRNLEFINGYNVAEHKEVTKKLLITFDVQQKKEKLQKYLEELIIKIGKIELADKTKKENYCKLDYDLKTFYFTMPNGSVQHFTLNTERSETENLFNTFKVLYQHWIEFEDEVITKIEMISKLKKLGWEDVDDYKIKNTINNLRDTKIKPAKLSQYIQILGDRKEKGYRLIITYPHSYSENNS